MKAMWDNPADLWTEITQAERFRDGYTRHMARLIRQYHGSAYGPDAAAKTDELLENHPAEYIGLVQPRLIYDNPRVRVRSRRPASQGATAKGIQHALNRWTRDSGYAEHLETLAQDMLLGFGVSTVVNEPSPFFDPCASQEDPRFPAVYRIDPTRFIMDPLATSFEDARWYGHYVIVTRETLLEVAEANPDEWDVEAIRGLSADNVTDAPERAGRMSEIDREEFRQYEIWVPSDRPENGKGPEQGFHGVIYTVIRGQTDVADADAARWVRKPIEYYGPPKGRYVLFGAYRVPRSPWPLSPLQQVDAQVRELDAHVKASAESAKGYKRLIICGSAEVANKVKNSPHDLVLTLPTFSKDEVHEVEIGGVTPAMLQYQAISRERLDRNSGVHDAQRGNVSGDGTATEVAVAAEAGTIRMAYLKQRFQRAVTAELKAVAWHLYHDERILMALGEEAAKDLGMLEPMFAGGQPQSDRDAGVSFADMEFEIEPYSMDRTTEPAFANKVAMFAQFVLAALPAAMQQPAFVGEVIEMYGDALNIPNRKAIVEQIQAQAGVPPTPDMPSIPAGPNPQGYGGMAKSIGASLGGTVGRMR